MKYNLLSQLRRTATDHWRDYARREIIAEIKTQQLPQQQQQQQQSEWRCAPMSWWHTQRAPAVARWALLGSPVGPPPAAQQ